MATRTDVFNGGIAPTWNGAYGLVATRKRVDLAQVIAEFGAIATGDVFQLFTMPKGFKPTASSFVVIKPDTGSGSLVVTPGATTYGLATTADLKAAIGTVSDKSPASPAVLAADTTVTVTLTGTTATDGIFEFVVMGYWLGPLPGDEA